MFKEIGDERAKALGVVQGKRKMASKALKNKTDFGWADFTILRQPIGKTNRRQKEIG